VEEEAVRSAKELLSGLLDHMGIAAEIEVSDREENLYVEMKGAHEGILIGRHGRTLESLQLVINRMMSNRLGPPVKVILDINSYRKRREESLREMAVRLGEKVKRTGRAQTIGPFNAHDRRVIHLAIREDPVLRTESQGEGEVKKIRIVPQESDPGLPGVTIQE
jgi:spoIIIJ-associated protein